MWKMRTFVRGVRRMAIIIEHMEMPNGCCACRMERENCCTLSLRRIDDIYDRPEWCLLTESEPSGNEYNGHWVQGKDGHGCECSECGTAYRWIEADTMRYCPSCGAKMDAPNNAYWIKQFNGEYKCSVCGDTTLAPLYKCSTCGAKMNGVVEE